MRKRTTRTGRLTAVAFCAALALLWQFVYAAAKPFDELVPDDVTQFMTLRNYREFVTRLKATPYYGLFQEPEVKALVDKAFTELSEGVGKMKEAVGFEPADVEKILSGQIALAMIQRLPRGPMGNRGGANAGEMWALLLVDVGPNEQQTRTMLERTLQLAAQEEEVTVTEEQFRGHAVKHVSVKQGAGGQMTEEEIQKLDPELREAVREAQRKQGAQGAETQKLYVSLEGGILAVAFGTDRSLLERHLVLRGGGDIRPIAQSDTYKAIMAQIDPKSDYVSFQSFQNIWDGLKAQAGGMMAMGVDGAAMLDEMGITGLKAQGGGGRLDEKGISQEAFVLVPMPRKGLLKSISPTDRVNVKPPAFVAKDAALYAGLFFDLPLFWAELKDALRKAAPQVHQQMEMGLNNPQSPIQVERDIINAIGSHWFCYIPSEAVVMDAKGGVQDVNLVFAIELRDTASFQRAFQQIMAMAPPDQGIRQVPFMGTTIYETPEGGGGGPFRMPALRFVFLNNMFFIATSEAMAKQSIRFSKQGQSTLLTKPEFTATLGQLPRRPEGIVYADHRYIGEWVYKFVDKIVPKDKIQLPRWETLKKYLYVSTSVFNWTDQGLKVTAWQPFPPAAD